MTTKIHRCGCVIRNALMLLVVCVSVRQLAAAEPGTPKPAVSLNGPELSAVPTWTEALRAVLLTAIPDKFEDLSHWDLKQEIFDGLRVKQRGFDITVSELKKKVNHGAWHKYKVEMLDPDRTLKLKFDRVHSVGFSRYQFDINLAAKLRCCFDFQHWVLGIKGFNVTVESDADVRMIARCQLLIRSEANPDSIFPDIVLEPKVTGLRLFLTKLDVHRIGEIGGDLAYGLGEISRRDIENLLQAQQGRALKKANEAIDKKRDSLRISVARLWK